MQNEEFEKFLQDRGIKYRYSGQSLVMKECPECGSQNWKVHFFRKREDESRPFFGKCFAGKCEQNYSSSSYLMKLGIPRDTVIELHGKGGGSVWDKFLPDLDAPDSEIAKPKEPEPSPDISKFFKISDWLDHPAAMYAIKRGLPKELYDQVMINHENNSVVFLCYKEGRLVGYQERFIKPFNPNMKTKTSPGFKVSEFVLEFANPGKPILVCEGPFTAVAAWVFGYHAICTFGSGMGEGQIQRILEIHKKTGQDIGIAVENDSAGLKAFDKLSKRLYWEKIPSFKVVSEEKDLNDALTKGKLVSKIDLKEEVNPLIPLSDFEDLI